MNPVRTTSRSPLFMMIRLSRSREGGRLELSPSAYEVDS